MSWEWMLALYILGFVLTGVVLYVAVHLGLRWQRELPKKPIFESIQALEQRLEERRSEFEELQEELYQAKNLIDQADRKRSWLEANEEHIRDLERKADELREVEEKLAGALEERDKVEEQTRELETRHAVLEAKLQGEQRIVEQLEELRRDRAELHAQIDAAGIEKQRLDQALTNAREELRGIQEAVRDATARKQEIEESHGRLSAEVAQMEEERNHLQRQIEALSTERAQVAPPEAATIEERTAALWSPVLGRADFAADAVGDISEEQALESALDRIRRSGLSFSDRSVRAFHTALKVSSESPLLVLAGISGTGKSALPRRYADAMGMHFLNVAVQPGWDSPLDLVGFYNHLEGRFKPTEFARALVQMDRFGDRRWPPAAREREDLSDRMLVVLLDEMNLAQIEYYFSDFLSKLEIRRDINPEIDRERRSSEVQLEIGRADNEATQTIPLFVGGNVLFVGTINEDESTQTLSDKVVDRSNVMRFGKPATLHPVAADADLDRPDALPELVWRSWRDRSPHLPEDEQDRVDRWIQRCNDELEEVGRPFGYRTAQIMREYIRQYPPTDDDRVLTAMADQIEMQVLPRMRGVDPQEGRAASALDAVYKLIDELGDEPLANAVDRARTASDAHLFLWQGVDRLHHEDAIAAD